MANELLRAEDLGKTYAKGAVAVEVLRGLELTLAPGQSAAVVGASGVGKSTLLHLLGALDPPTAGEVWFKGKAMSSFSESERASFRNHSIGFVFQFHYLLPELNALENVALPLRMRREGEAASNRRAKELLEAVGVAHRLDHRPSELSGGEQQRVAIARALVGNPELVLADEPTGNLDLETARTVAPLLFDLGRREGRSLVVATHNPELAARADRIFRLRDGRLVEEVRA